MCTPSSAPDGTDAATPLPLGTGKNLQDWACTHVYAIGSDVIPVQNSCKRWRATLIPNPGLIPDQRRSRVLNRIANRCPDDRPQL